MTNEMRTYVFNENNSCQINLAEFECWYKHPEQVPYDDIIKEFEKNGFKVSKKALEHNYDAWSGDLKSAYRDEENGVYVFTPCGCNGLGFNLSPLKGDIECQPTYIC